MLSLHLCLSAQWMLVCSLGKRKPNLLPMSSCEARQQMEKVLFTRSSMCGSIKNAQLSIAIVCAMHLSCMLSGGQAPVVHTISICYPQSIVGKNGAVLSLFEC